MDQQQYTTLVDVLKQVPDPRKHKGQRNRFLTLLCLIVAAIASAQRTPRAIARWVHEHREELFAALRPSVSRLPSDVTIRRALARLDVAALELALTAFRPPLAPPSDAPAAEPTTLQSVAIDGKAIRGVGRSGPACHLVSLVQHADARVLNQVAVALKRDKRSAVPVLLALANLIWMLLWRQILGKPPAQGLLISGGIKLRAAVRHCRRSACCEIRSTASNGATHCRTAC